MSTDLGAHRYCGQNERALGDGTPSPAPCRPCKGGHCFPRRVRPLQGTKGCPSQNTADVLHRIPAGSNSIDANRRSELGGCNKPSPQGRSLGQRPCPGKLFLKAPQVPRRLNSSPCSKLAALFPRPSPRPLFPAKQSRAHMGIILDKKKQMPRSSQQRQARTHAPVRVCATGSGPSPRVCKPVFTPKSSCLKSIAPHQTLTKATTPLNRPQDAVLPRERTARRLQGTCSPFSHPDPRHGLYLFAKKLARNPHAASHQASAAPTPSLPSRREHRGRSLSVSAVHRSSAFPSHTTKSAESGKGDGVG